MKTHRFPEDLEVTAQNFSESNWREILDSTPSEGYSSIWQSFSSAARNAIDEGDVVNGKMYWLIADACSMALVPSKHSEPFKPYAVFSEHRSAVADDFTSSDISFFSEIIDHIEDIWIKSRLADLLWLRVNPRNPDYALMAIDAYRSIPLTEDSYHHDAHDCWSRAASLTKLLKAGAGDRLQEIEASILSVFDDCTKESGFLCLWLSQLLRENKLAQGERERVANKLEVLANEFDQEADIHKARDYFTGALDWYRDLALVDKKAKMNASLAECYVKEAEYRLASSQPSYSVAAHFYETAIQTYRTIPRSERPTLNVDERIAELRRLLDDAGQRALDQMGVIKTPGLDITELVDGAKKIVSGKSVADALLHFTHLSADAEPDKLRESALADMQRSPFQLLVSTTIVGRDGRVVARRPAIGLQEEATEEDEIAIKAVMVQNHTRNIGLIVHGSILPALEVLAIEHRLRESDFISLAYRSPIVPKDRVHQFGKALMAGYEKDFITALHLLVPQIENLVRVHLKQADVVTTTLSDNGVQTENGMSTLMAMPEAEAVFGDSVVFELRSLFCDSFGPNLRNEIAHGLLDDESVQSQYAIYAWWYALRLVFNTWWNRAHASEERDTQ